MDEYLTKLNDSQLEAVTTTEGFVRVIAGAGSGKTRALTYRYAYLVNELGITPENILCVTFTNKAANEMRQRVHNLIGDNDTAYICTFHSFCVSVLQEDSNAVSYPKSFLVLDNSDIDDMLKIIYEERGLTLRDMTFSKARDMIEIQKLIKHPDYYLDMIEMSPEILYSKYMEATDARDIIFYGYLYQEKKCFGLDYNDLIKFSLYIFEKNSEIREKWQQRLEYIMIDEFQDIDTLQYELMEVLSGYHKNLFIVGDPDQTIYTWRGANVRFLLEFDLHHANTKTIMMMQNYRSTPQILSAVNSLISTNKNRMEKQLIPVNKDGESVLCHFAESPEKEALWISSKIKELVNGGEKYKNITLLYRAHYVTRTIEEVFIKQKIPYTIYSGVQFFGRMEIKDALSYLRMIAYKDDLSFLRIANVPKRNLGQRRMAFIKEMAERDNCTYYEALYKNLDDEIFKGTGAAKFVKLVEEFNASYSERPVSEVLSDLLDRSGYEKMLRTEGNQERLDNLAELRQAIYEFETTCGEEATLEHYLTHIALFSNFDMADCGDKVRLMTVHAAKGLEFPHVFLIEMNEGIFPSKKTASLDAMEEERRLAFVAMTRAEKRLYISEADGRNFDGTPRYPSRFILDIDKDLLEFTNEPEEGLVEMVRSYIRARDSVMPNKSEKELFSIGQRIKHAVFGEGKITGIDEVKGIYVIQFESLQTPRNLSFRTKLEKL